jgi:hypothetical protein
MSSTISSGVINFKSCFLYSEWSRDSSVGIATRYGLEGPGMEYRWGESFRTYPDRLRGPPTLLYNGYRIFPGSKGGGGVMLTTHFLPVPNSRKSWAIPPLTLWVLLGLLRASPYPPPPCVLNMKLTSQSRRGERKSVQITGVRRFGSGPPMCCIYF